MSRIKGLPPIPKESKHNYNYFIVFQCKDNKKRYSLFMLRDRPHTITNDDNIIEYIDYISDPIRSIHFTCLVGNLCWKERLICPNTKLSKELLIDTKVYSNFDLMISKKRLL